MKQTVDAGKSDVAWAYLRANEDRFIAAFTRRISTLAPHHDRLAWVPRGLATRFHDALYQALDGEQLFIKLPELLHPTDPWYVIDRNRALSEGTAGVVVDGREPTGPLFWNPLAGDALAIDVTARIQESLARMVPRFVAQLDGKKGAAPAVDDLVTSHPIDRVTARLLCDRSVLAPIGGKTTRKHHGPSDPSLFRDGFRFLETYRWMGSEDPKLWNYLEVTAPRDATVEEVAATLWLDPGASFRAYGITAAPPYFRVEPTWARMHPDAKRYAPEGVDAPHQDSALALAGSAFATDAAIAQASDERRFDKRGIPLPADSAHLETVLDRSSRQLERAKAHLAPWKLWELVTPAARWVAAHREHLLSIPDHRLVALAPAIEGQQEVLFEAAGAIVEIAASAGGAAGIEGDTGVITSVLRLYATAMGESHLIDTARAAMTRARTAKGTLAFDLLEQSSTDTQGAVNDLRSNEGRMPWGGDAENTALAANRRRILELRGRHAAGETLPAGEVELASAELKDTAITARVKSLYLQLHNLSEEARDAQSGFFETLASGFSCDVRALPGLLSKLRTSLQEEVLEPHVLRKRDALQAAGSNASPAVRATILREAAAMTEKNLATLVRENHIAEAFGPWIAVVERQQTRAAVLKIAAHIAILIGTSIVGSMAGTAVASAVRGALLADAADATIGMLWATRIATGTGAVSGLAADAAVNATVQSALGGGGLGDGFLDNFIANGAVRVALAPLYKVAEAYGGARAEIENLSLWERNLARGKTVLRASALLTTEMITGAAVDYVVQRYRHGERPDEKTAMEWALNGGSMAIGAFVGKWLHGYQARLGSMMEHGAHLKVRARRMAALARRVEEHGDPDGALTLLAERHTALEEEASAIHDLHAKGKITSQTASTLELGNRTEMNAVHDASFATMPLRLAGLSPDDASGKIWAGSTEDIAIALHQAHRAGLSVTVLDHDQAARQWKVLYNGEELTILETGLVGQPRAAKAPLTDADRRHARRYAESAAYLQERWEAKTKLELDRREVIEVDHLQIGHEFAGVVNQATLPTTGEGLGAKLVIYDHKGTLSGRGAQELGQAPDKFDAPGVRTTEQAPGGTEWVRSEELGRALDVGRLETQTPAYQGRVVEIEARAKASGTEPWKAPARAFRAKVRDAAGVERWFYSDRLDNVGGLGPGNLADAAKVIDPQHLSAMLAGAEPQLLRGDDPDYRTKVRRGRVLVWGGSPTGAWGAERVVHAPETKVTVLGDTREPQDWPTLLREYEEINLSIASHPGAEIPADLSARKTAIEQLIAKAHSGMTLRRNTKPGATYEKPVTGRGPDDVQIEFGTPSRIAPTADGRVMVTIGSGEAAQSSVYDQVVVAHGQDPAQPGAPGGLLGPGARAGGAVPAGTIALRPIYGPQRADGGEREILGLESIDPPGLQLKGAAFASKRMSPWVEQGQRAAFERAVDAMAAEHAQTRDHGEVTSDSRGVSVGMEVQRDRLPRANEVLGAKAYRLPGERTTLELDPDHLDTWDEQVREFFTQNLRANGKWVRVKRLGGGRSRAVLYRVWVDENDVGVFKLFDGKGGAHREQEMLQLLADAHLKTMTPVRERGTIGIDPKTGYDSALLMDMAKGTSVKELIEHLPTDAASRPAAIKQLQLAAKRVAIGLAEMHGHFESGGMMTKQAKLEDANYFLDKNFRGGSDVARVRAALGEAAFMKVKERLEADTLPKFLAAEVPATAYHGDANAGNFLVEDYNQERGFKNLGVIDVGSMSYSIQHEKGTKTGAADVARFLGSFESLAPGALNARELADIRADFMRAYFAGYRGRRIDRAAYAAAEKWYRIEMEVAALKGDQSAKQRILDLLEVEP